MAPPSALRPEVPGWVDELLLAALAQDPRQRAPVDLLEFAAALRRPPPPPPPRPAATSLRRRVGVALLVPGAAAAAAGWGGLLVSMGYTYTTGTEGAYLLAALAGLLLGVPGAYLRFGPLPGAAATPFWRSHWVRRLIGLALVLVGALQADRGLEELLAARTTDDGLAAVARLSVALLLGVVFGLQLVFRAPPGPARPDES